MIKLFKKREDPKITTTYKVYHIKDYDYSDLEKFLKIECNLSGSAINTITQEINSSVIKLEYVIYQGGNIFLRDRSSFYKEFKCISGFKKSIE